MKFVKVAVGAALALAMVGCGGQDAAPSADGAASAPAAKAVAKVYEPKALDGTAIAVQYRKNTSESLKPVVDAIAASFKNGFTEALAEADGDDDAAKVKKLYADSGLEGADVKWALVTAGGVSLAELLSDKVQVPDVAIAVAFDHDIDKIVAALLATLDEDEKNRLVETKVAGLKAWKADDEDAKEAGAEPCFTSLDGKLFLGATSPALLERLVALYADGKGGNSAFETLSSGGGAVLRAFVPAFGELLKKAVESGGSDGLAAIDMVIPNGSKILLGFGEVDFAVLADASGVSVKLSVNTATDEDANSLRTMLNAYWTSCVESLKNSDDEEDKLAYSALKDLKLGGEGKTFTAKLPIPDDLIKKALEEMSEFTGAFVEADDDEDDDEADEADDKD